MKTTNKFQTKNYSGDFLKDYYGKKSQNSFLRIFSVKFLWKYVLGILASWIIFFNAIPKVKYFSHIDLGTYFASDYWLGFYTLQENSPVLFIVGMFALSISALLAFGCLVYPLLSNDEA